MNHRYYLTIQFREATAGGEELDCYYSFISKYRARRLKGGRANGTSKLVLDSRKSIPLEEITGDLHNIKVVCFEPAE